MVENANMGLETRIQTHI